MQGIGVQLGTILYCELIVVTISEIMVFSICPGYFLFLHVSSIWKRFVVFVSIHLMFESV